MVFGCRRLATMPADSGAAKFAAVAAQRALNRVAATLDEANAALEGVVSSWCLSGMRV
jgi:hypothetical protein